MKEPQGTTWSPAWDRYFRTRYAHLSMKDYTPKPMTIGDFEDGELVLVQRAEPWI